MSEAPVESSTPAAAPAEAPIETQAEVTPAAPAESAPAAASTTETAPVPAAEEPKPAPAAPASDAAAKIPPATPLTKLFAELKSITAEAEYGEMWGVELADEQHVPSAIVLEKFLRANNMDVAKAKAQLLEALKWRKRLQPAKLLTDTEFDSARFGGLGYVTVYPKTHKHEKEVVTWNIYGGIKDIKATFGNVEE